MLIVLHFSKVTILLVPEGVIDKIFLPKLDICCECEVVKSLVEPPHFINSLGILRFDSLYVGLENVHSCAGLQDSQQC